MVQSKRLAMRRKQVAGLVLFVTLRLPRGKVTVSQPNWAMGGNTLTML